MEDRGKVRVGLPVPSPTRSYWQETPSPMASHRTTPDLPQHADYLIIGSGITGATIAHHLLSRFAPGTPAPSILMLEARGAASGATGRNGGHTKAASYRSFTHARAAAGEPEAVRIAQLEHATFRAVHALATDLHIDCDAHVCPTADIFFDAAQLDASAAVAAHMNATITHGVERYTVLDRDQARARFHCPDALGAITYDAGSISGYRFATGLLERCVAHGLNLQTHTPVTSLSQTGTGAWLAATDRGFVTATNAILATNGYSAFLEPALQGIVVPLRGQITAQRPGAGLPRPLPSTYTFSYGEGYEYMIPTPAGSKEPGTIVIGGGWGRLANGGAEEFGVTDDSVLHGEISQYLHDCTARYFGANWGADDEKGRIRKEWTGIMGNSADGVPYVGEMSSKKGLWVCVSFNGHGMVLCERSAAALVTMLAGSEREKAELDEWFPRTFVMSEDRLKAKFQGRRNVKPPEALEERAQL